MKKAEDLKKPGCGLDVMLFELYAFLTFFLCFAEL